MPAQRPMRLGYGRASRRELQWSSRARTSCRAHALTLTVSRPGQHCRASSATRRRSSSVSAQNSPVVLHQAAKCVRPAASQAVH